jgi:hypothetical protein
MPGFPPRFFLSSSTVVTWLPDVTEGHLTPSGFPWVCACATGSCATPVVTHSEVSLGCSLRRPRPIFSMVTGTSTRVQIPSFLHILWGENRACAEHTSGHVTSGQKAPLGRILRNFRCCMHKTYFRTGHVTNVTSSHVTDVTFGHVTSGPDPPHDPPQIWLELCPYTTSATLPSGAF